MLKEINSFPSFFLPYCHDKFSDCCRSPSFRENVGNRRGTTNISYSANIRLVEPTPFHLYSDSHLVLPNNGVRDGTRY